MLNKFIHIRIYSGFLNEGTKVGAIPLLSRKTNFSRKLFLIEKSLEGKDGMWERKRVGKKGNIRNQQVLLCEAL